MARALGRLSVLLLLAAVSAAAGASDRAAKEAELAQLKDRIVALQRELEGARGRYDEQRRELRRVEKRVGDLARGLRELDGQLEERTRRLAELERRRRGLNADVGEQRGRLAQQVRAAFLAGRQEYLKILLNQEDPAAVGRMLTYYDYLNRARSKRINALQVTLRELETVRSAITEETRRLERLREDQSVQKRDLEQTRSERERLLAELQQQIRSKDDDLKSMRADREELERLIRALTEALADIPPQAGKFKPFGEEQGRLSWPTDGRILASFGSRRGRAGLKWQGVLIDGKEGGSVRAVSRGRVAFADWLRGYGLLIIIDHGDAYMTLYGHNQSLYKETGDWVEAGEVIAAVGASGGHDRTGLYFEIRHNGRPADPVRWCRR